MARHHHRTVIRREHPARARVLRLLFGLALVAALAGAYYWGHRTGSVRLAPFSDGNESCTVALLNWRHGQSWIRKPSSS